MWELHRGIVAHLNGKMLGLLENLECVVERNSEVELRGVATSSTM